MSHIGLSSSSVQRLHAGKDLWTDVVLLSDLHFNFIELIIEILKLYENLGPFRAELDNPVYM